jgi:predicted acetyltransferase
VEIEVRQLGFERINEFMVPIATAMGFVPRPEWSDKVAKMPEFDVRLAAYDGDALVGAAGSFTFELTTPGGAAETAGLTMVGVLASHRRRGILRTLMRRYLDDARERGQPISALWASEGPIYGRFGYGLASLEAEIEVDRDRSGFVVPVEDGGRRRIVSEDEAAELFPPIWDEVRGDTPGMPARSPKWWRVRRLSDPEFQRRGGGLLQRLLIELDGRPAAYALYRHHGGWESGIPTGSLRVIEAIGVTPEATRALWRYLLDIDLVARIEAALLPVDHPLVLLASEPARLRLRLAPGLWVRIVDVATALAARSYGSDGSLVFELADAFCPWNEGRWRVAEGKADRSEEEPELSLDAAALGSAYLGGFSFTQLGRAGRVQELREGALARADALFRSEVARPRWEAPEKRFA